MQKKKQKNKEKQKDIKLLIILVLALILINYPFLDNFLKNLLTETETIHVDRVIDGDTIESNRTSIRLLGINAPERGELYYEEAKEFLESIILNKTVILKFGKDRYDKYDRTLAYIFLNNKNINLELVENGFANYYFPSGKDIYYSEFSNAWEKCINKNINLCEKSADICSQCIELKDSMTLKNICSFECDISNWKIKTEGRENIILEEILNDGEELEFNLTLTPTGDTIFLWDDEGKLVLWERY